jgi:hypothetical protein
MSGPVWLFERNAVGLLPSLPPPDPKRPVFCQGWYPPRAGGRYMSERHAPFWVRGLTAMTFAPSDPRPRVHIHDGPRGWKLVTVDMPRLVHVRGERRSVGAQLLRVRTS